MSDCDCNFGYVAVGVKLIDTKANEEMKIQYRFKRCKKECPEDIERLKEWFQ